MGEEKKEEKEKEKEKKKEENKDEKKEEEKKEEETPEIVLKVDMHCQACARKVARALKGFEGVEEVSADSKASKVVVKGKGADPIKVCQRLQKKSGRKVELISPLPDHPEEKKEAPKEAKEEPPVTATVVLNVPMHCEACAQVLQKRIRKIKGVESVETNLANGHAIVKGVVDPAKLVDDVYKKTRKPVSIVKNEEKKEAEKKEEEKDGEKKDDGGGEEAGKGEDEKKLEIKRSEYWMSKYYLEYAYYDPPPDQLFSDENPNACFIM